MSPFRIGQFNWYTGCTLQTTGVWGHAGRNNGAPKRARSESQYSVGTNSFGEGGVRLTRTSNRRYSQYYSRSLTCAGIFRVPGDTAHVTTLKIQIENGDYSCAGLDDPHIPGSLLKLWMRELADPIIPCEYYDDAIDAAKNDDENMAVAILPKLPELNRKVPCRSTRI